MGHRRKAHGAPVYELLGGRVHDRIRAYTYLDPTADEAVDVHQTAAVHSDPAVAAQRAVEEVENLGFTAVKFDPAGPYTVYDGYMPPLVTGLINGTSHILRVRAVTTGAGPSSSVSATPLVPAPTGLVAMPDGRVLDRSGRQGCVRACIR